jgi:hypothetical protein
VRGDGNCFYRAFHVSWLERLLQMPPALQSDAWGRLVPTATQCYARHLPQPLGAELLRVGANVAEVMHRLCGLGSRGESRTLAGESRTLAPCWRRCAAERD